MGKKKKRAPQSSGGTNGAVEKQEGKYSVNDLLKKAEELMDNFQFELALKFCERALNSDPTNIKALEMSGNIYAEIGDIDNAKLCLLKVVEVSPQNGYEKYMYLGQLSEGEESIQYYNKGVEIIQSNISVFEEGKSAAEGAGSLTESISNLKRYESNAYCSIAEVYLTDSCFEESAEVECERYCQLAIEADPSNAEAYFAFANFLLSKDDEERAKEMACKSLEIWMPKNDDPANNIDSEDISSGSETLHIDSSNEKLKPNFESRLNLSKILIEVKEYEKAVFVLTDLHEENDEEIQILYLLGLVHHLNNDQGTSLMFLERGKELYEKLNIDDEQLIADIVGLIEAISKDFPADDEEAIVEEELEESDDHMETE